MHRRKITLKKKHKYIFIGSLILNLIFLISFVIGYLRMNLVHEELFYSEVQNKLVELEGLIEHQKKNNWSQPNLVTTQLGDVLNGIDVAMNSGKYSRWISNEDRTTMEHLDATLRQFPHDELYTFSKITEKDKDDFERMQLYLRKSGYGLNMTISNDWNQFIERCNSLYDLIQEK